MLLALWMRKEQRSGPHDAWVPACAGTTDTGSHGDAKMDSRLCGETPLRSTPRLTLKGSGALEKMLGGMTGLEERPPYAGMTKALYY